MSSSRRWSQRVLTFAVGLLACGLARTTARAQGMTTYSIGVMGGLAIPVSDLGDATSSGYTLGVTLGMHPPLSPASFRLEGSFTELPFKGASDSKFRIYGFAADGRYNLGTASDNGGLYLTGGVGYYGSKATNTLFGDTSTDWNLGLNGGLGYYVPLSGFTVVFEGRYTHIFSDNPSLGLFPITVGIVF